MCRFRDHRHIQQLLPLRPVIQRRAVCQPVRHGDFQRVIAVKGQLMLHVLPNKNGVSRMNDKFPSVPKPINHRSPGTQMGFAEGMAVELGMAGIAAGIVSHIACFKGRPKNVQIQIIHPKGEVLVGHELIQNLRIFQNAGIAHAHFLLFPSGSALHRLFFFFFTIHRRRLNRNRVLKHLFIQTGLLTFPFSKRTSNQREAPFKKRLYYNTPQMDAGDDQTFLIHLGRIGRYKEALNNPYGFLGRARAGVLWPQRTSSRMILLISYASSCFSRAAAMKPLNRGWALLGRDLNSGWNCTPT